MNIREDTIELFEQDKYPVIEYLKNRGINNAELFQLIMNNPFGLLKENVFYIDDEPYGITHFLSKSEITGYDIEKANNILGLSETDTVAFAAVEGDDVICCDAKSGEVFLLMVQTGEYERIHIADDLSAFLNSIEI